MTLLRFLWYVLKNGSLFGKPVNFDSLRRDALNPSPQPKSTYASIRDWLAKTRLLGSLIDNIAYLKSLNRVNKNYFFVDSLRLGYVRILKSASTSILKELLPRMDTKLDQDRISDIEVDQLATRYVRHTLDESRQEYQLFTIVRNPFQRLVSVYQDLFDPNNVAFVYRTYLFGILKEKMSFAEFVKVLVQIPDGLKSPHFASQSKIVDLCNSAGGIKIFRLEKDTVQIQEFLSQYNLTLDHRNKGTQSDYRSFYDAETVKLVYAIYDEDVTKFGYEEEYNSLLSPLNG